MNMKTKTMSSKDLKYSSEVAYLMAGGDGTVYKGVERGQLQDRGLTGTTPKWKGHGTSEEISLDAAPAYWNHPGMLAQHCESFQFV